MRRSNYLEPQSKLAKLQLRDSSSFHRKSPKASLHTKGLLSKNPFREQLRYVSPDLEPPKTSRPKSSHLNPKNGIGLSYEDSKCKFLQKHPSKRRSSVHSGMTSNSHKGPDISRSNNNSYVKRETVRMAHNLKEILEKHMAYNSERKKVGKRQGQKYLTPKKNSNEKRSIKRNLGAKGSGERYQQENKNKGERSQEKAFDYILKYSYRSRKGHTPSNPSKPNQDTYIISTNLHQQTWSHYFGVCDGHGQLGHKVSAFLKNSIPQSLKRIKHFDSKPKENLMTCYRQISHRLCTESKIDVSLSGTTCVGCYFSKDTLYCCNVGDSRAIIGNYDKSWSTVQLSQDHKPTLPLEAQRIKQNKGVVEPFKHSDGTFVGPMRVWLPKGNGPGLAMSRSFGDMVAASVGVSSVPQIREYKMSQKDRIIVIASDGVWQFMQNIQVVNLLSSFYQQDQIQLGCDKLMYTVYNRWIQNSSVIDDITFVVVFLYYQ